MKNISDHITYNEATHSATAIRNGIRNVPDDEQLGNMERIAKNIFEPLRAHFGDHPIRINSFFRSPRLNKAVGGSKTSQHAKGQAMDIDDSYGFTTNKEIFDYIRQNLDFDQMIWEFGGNDNPDWVHVSFVSKEKNRRNIIRAARFKGKTVYIPYE
jgi:zinc D-Ala-D-Ala carboxypeptidase